MVWYVTVKWSTEEEKYPVTAGINAMREALVSISLKVA